MRHAHRKRGATDLIEPVLITKVVGRIVHDQDQVLIILLGQLNLQGQFWPQGMTRISPPN